MKLKNFLKSLNSRVIFFIVIAPWFAFAKPQAIFLSTDHCVAWKAKKVVALVKNVEPIGKNCKITVALKSVEAGGFQFVGRFPVAGFDSQEPDRDKEVNKILKADTHPDLIFESLVMSKEQWSEILQNGTGEIPGNLSAAGVSAALTFAVSAEKNGENYVFTGSVVSNYTTFKITPPKVAGGLIAKAKDYLEFHFRFQSSQLAGFAELVK